MLTDKTSDLFAKWYQSNKNAVPGLFDDLPDLVKLAYYVAFFDENGISIGITDYLETEFNSNIQDEFFGWKNSRPEALKSAVIKADEIMNLKLKK